MASFSSFIPLRVIRIFPCVFIHCLRITVKPRFMCGSNGSYLGEIGWELRESVRPSRSGAPPGPDQVVLHSGGRDPDRRRLRRNTMSALWLRWNSSRRKRTLWPSPRGSAAARGSSTGRTPGCGRGPDRSVEMLELPLQVAAVRKAARPDETCGDPQRACVEQLNETAMDNLILLTALERPDQNEGLRPVRARTGLGLDALPHAGPVPGVRDGPGPLAELALRGADEVAPPVSRSQVRVSALTIPRSITQMRWAIPKRASIAETISSTVVTSLRLPGKTS
jgi:hypothetical protein